MPHALLLFIHILGGVGLFIGGTCELVGLQLLLRAKSVEFLRAATTLTRLALVVDPLSGIAVAATGLSFIITAWGWSVAWIDVALASFALITLAAPALQGRRFLAIHRIVAHTPDGAVPENLHRLIHDPVLRVSVQCVLPLATGLLALMALKPGLVEALVIMGVALLAGIATALLTWPRAHRALHAPVSGSRTGKTLT